MINNLYLGGKSMQDIKKIRDVLQEVVCICDELIDLEERDKEGQDVSKEAESAIGRLVIKFMQLEALK